MNNPYYPPYTHTAAWQNMPSQPGMYPSSPPAAPVPTHNPALWSMQQPANGAEFSRFIKGALVGAAVAYVLTNEKVQRGAIKGAVKAWSLVQGGVEEMKEKFRDAEAELHAAQMQDEQL